MDQVIRRQDLVEADLRCLMCARLIGRLAGLVWRDAGAQRPSGSTMSLTAFRPAGPGQPGVLVRGRHRFRCDHCGGMAVMEVRRPKGCLCTEWGRAA